jgi:hypothetical protein
MAQPTLTTPNHPILYQQSKKIGATDSVQVLGRGRSIYLALELD